MSHKHIAMEATLNITDVTRKTALRKWWLSVTPPTMALFVKIVIEYIPCARPFAPWPAQLYLYN